MLDEKRDFRTPPGTKTVGMWLFLIALTMLFAATILAYVIIRLSSARSPPRGAIHLPMGLWLSTAVILCGSYTIHQALVAVRFERQRLLRRWLVATAALALTFILVQVPSLVMLWQRSFAGERDTPL